VWLFAWMILGVITFFILLKVTAPFGRYSTGNWGPMMNNRLAWFIMEFTVLIVFWWFAFPAALHAPVPTVMMLGLFTLHYVNRSLIFPVRIKTPRKKMPVIIMLSAITFNLVNGSALGYYFAHFSAYENSWLTDARFIGGLFLFIAGMGINWRADNTLIHLRQPGESGYKIPRGKLFEFLSCPNHFGEMVEWLGFAILCWNLPAWVFFIWTCANLIPRSMAHHKWYRQNFPEYPEKRKAVIPFLI
jgi:hypothetical protein